MLNRVEGRDSMRETNPVQPAPIDGPIYDPDYTWPYTEDYFTYKKRMAGRQSAADLV